MAESLSSDEMCGPTHDGKKIAGKEWECASARTHMVAPNADIFPGLAIQAVESGRDRSRVDIPIGIGMHNASEKRPDTAPARGRSLLVLLAHTIQRRTTVVHSRSGRENKGTGVGRSQC